jgi:uracil-DNA glycosylase family 4
VSDVRQQVAEHLRFAGELGVTGLSRDPKWRAGAASSSELPASPPSPAGSPAGFGETGESPIRVCRNAAEALAAIKTEIGPDCPRCKLATLGRKQVVFGVGNPDADLMFVGEAPGADEDIQGIPFVGRAGQLLTKMILAINLERDQVYIANVIKCRPPGNRNPEPDEIASCEPFLFQQIDAVRPKVIVALGAFAAKTLLRTEDPISRLRGRIYDFRGAKLIPTFHPSFLLRSPERKRDAWEDLKKARAILTGPVTGDE